MKPNNVAYQQNGMDIPAYFDFDDMMDAYVETLKETRDGMWSDEYEKCLIMEEYSDDSIIERAFEYCIENNSDMKKYLHMKDHKIFGNFNNIEWDYERRVKEETGRWGDFKNLVKRLDDMDDSPETNSDRKWIVGWFFETFGTFGIKYSFSSEIADYLYTYQQECGKGIIS